MSIIEDMFRGNCHPTERIIPKSPEYAAVNQKQKDLLAQLRITISEQDNALLEEFLNAKAYEHFYLELEYCRKGIQFGAQLCRVLSEEV